MYVAIYFTREQHWVRERDNVVGHYIPTLHDQSDSRSTIRELRANNLFPSIDAPTFNMFGGVVPNGFQLNMTGEEGTIHYTLDGREPDRNTPQYDGPIRLEASTDLKVRAYDAGGNAERVQTLPYAIGPRGPVAPAVGETPEIFPVTGGLRMASALIDVAGALSGRPDAACSRTRRIWLSAARRSLSSLRACHSCHS